MTPAIPLWRRVWLGVILTIWLCPGEAGAQQFIQTGRDTLRGLPGLEVIVEPLAPELLPGGISAAKIRANIEMQLRAAGITVYGSQALNESAAKPYLYVQVNGLPLQRQGYALAIQVQVRQTLRSPVTS